MSDIPTPFGRIRKFNSNFNSKEWDKEISKEKMRILLAYHQKNPAPIGLSALEKSVLEKILKNYQEIFGCE